MERNCNSQKPEIENLRDKNNFKKIKNSQNPYVYFERSYMHGHIFMSETYITMRILS